jgi:hypothetical protein
VTGGNSLPFEILEEIEIKQEEYYQKQLENTEYTILYYAFTSENSNSRKQFNDYCMKYIKGCTQEILAKLWKNKKLFVNGWKDTRTTKTGTTRFYELRDKGYNQKWDFQSNANQETKVKP